MLLSGYTTEIFKSKCDPGAKGVHCFARLNEDVGPVLPYLNTRLGGFTITQSPPSLTLKAHGKLITIHSRKIAVNALRDTAEAEKILAWLQREINQTWDERDTIEPSHNNPRRPVLLEILKRLPRTNCRECGEPTCMVFASRMAEGVKGVEDCPPLAEKEELAAYMAAFTFPEPI